MFVKCGMDNFWWTVRRINYLASAHRPSLFVWSKICVNYKFLITRAWFNYRCRKICHFFTDTGTFRYLLLIFTYINFENFNIWDSLKNKKWDLTPKCLIFGYFGSKITKKLFLEALQPLNIDSCLSPHIGKLI